MKRGKGGGLGFCADESGLPAADLFFGAVVWAVIWAELWKMLLPLSASSNMATAIVTGIFVKPGNAVIDRGPDRAPSPFRRPRVAPSSILQSVRVRGALRRSCRVFRGHAPVDNASWDLSDSTPPPFARQARLEQAARPVPAPCPGCTRHRHLANPVRWPVVEILQLHRSSPSPAASGLVHIGGWDSLLSGEVPLCIRRWL